jgi:hypothetical protein
MPTEDPEREARIDNEIVLDCFNETERAMGWYYYLQQQLSFPFKATCVANTATSPLRVNEEVHAVSMAEEQACMQEIHVRVQRGGGEVDVPLRQLRCHSRSRKTKQAVQDWHYWLFRGYEF